MPRKKKQETKPQEIPTKVDTKKEVKSNGPIHRTTGMG